MGVGSVQALVSDDHLPLIRALANFAQAPARIDRWRSNAFPVSEVEHQHTNAPFDEGHGDGDASETAANYDDLRRIHRLLRESAEKTESGTSQTKCASKAVNAGRAEPARQ